MNNTETEFIYKKLNSTLDQHSKQTFILAVSKQQIDPIIKLWRTQVILHGPVDHQMKIITHVVKQIVSQHDNYLKNITLEEIDGVARYLQKTRALEDILNILNFLYLKRNIEIFHKSKLLFQTLVHTFQYIQTDELRDIAVNILVEMMKKTPEFILYSSEPYFFLEYLLHLINQEQKEYRIIVWWDYIKSFYMHDKAHYCLFSKNDFKILIDILVRQIQNFTSEKALIQYLETYLVLSLEKYLISDHKYYKIDQILMALSEVQHPSKAIEQYTNEINSLTRQKH